MQHIQKDVEWKRERLFFFLQEEYIMKKKIFFIQILRDNSFIYHSRK